MSEGYELSISRSIDVTRATVWRAFAERLADWWVPRPWTVELIAHELRPSGRSAMVMRGPGGEEAAQEGVFLEVVPHERVVFTDAFAAGWMPRTPFMIGILEFAYEGGGTRYTGRARHWSAEDMERHRAMGFEQGWAIVADQLAEVAAAIARDG